MEGFMMREHEKRSIKCFSMSFKQEIHSLENRLRYYPSRTLDVFKTTHLTRILRKHISETDVDH